ncbi:MAG: class I SAM-dependent methyltransferase [Aquificaceae bacterium]
MLNCPICASPREEKDFIETYVSSFNKQEYKLYHCPSCDLMWWEPLQIIPEFYEQEGEESYALFHMGLREEIGENHKMFFEYIPLKAGRLLDVGCGDGVFLKEAKRAGFEVWGIDFDSKSIKVCQEKWGLKNTFVMSPYEFVSFCEKEGLKFDVITFFEVLEHQDRPREFLEAIKSMLKPGGYIAGSVPNNQLIKGIKKPLNYGNGNMPPHHFLWFNASSLSNTLRNLGFADLLIKEVKFRGFYRTITENAARIEWAILGMKGVYLRENIKRSLLKTSQFRTSKPRKALFKLLKGIRNLTFLGFALLGYPLLKGHMIYFQAKKIT